MFNDHPLPSDHGFEVNEFVYQIVKQACGKQEQFEMFAFSDIIIVSKKYTRELNELTLPSS